MSYYSNTKAKKIEESDDQQGQIRSSSSQQDDNLIEEAGANNKNQNPAEDQIYDSASSDEENDKDRLQQEKKKREDFWKTINLSKPEATQNISNIYENALQAASKTNKRILMLRKKNRKRIQQVQNMRMSQMMPLASANTHFRSSINEYPLITIDQTGKKYSHPNTSLKVFECRLDQFIQKNIAEQGTSNYLNEVVKFQNFAYQHRKKRRQNFQ